MKCVIPSERNLPPGLTILRVFKIKAAAGVPLAALVTIGRDTAVILEEFRQVHQVPGHEGCVAVGEVVAETDDRPIFKLVTVTRARPGFADPAGIRLWRDNVA